MQVNHPMITDSLVWFLSSTGELVFVAHTLQGQVVYLPVYERLLRGTVNFSAFTDTDTLSIAAFSLSLRQVL